MSLPVSLRDVINEMAVFNDEWSAYLNRKTGELFTVTDDDIRALENEDEDEDEPSHPQWKQESLAKAREVLGSDDWLALPSKFEIHEYHIMERFCLSVEDDMLQGDLLDAIRGSGAFGRFKSMVDRHGLLDRWHRYRDKALEDIAVEWLKVNNIPYKK